MEYQDDLPHRRRPLLFYVSSGLEPGFGASQKATDFTEGLANEGYDPRVVSIYPGRQYERIRKSGGKVVALRHPRSVPSSEPGHVQRLITAVSVRDLRRFTPHAGRVAGVFTAAPQLLPLAGRLARTVGAPCFWEVPRAPRWKRPFGYNRHVLRRMMRTYDVTAIANSRYTLGLLREMGLDGVLAYPGTDPERFDPRTIPPIPRNALSVPEDAVAFGIFSRFVPEKGHHVFIRALARFARESAPDTQIRCLLVGGDPGSSFGRSLQGICREEGYPDLLAFAGQVEDPERYYGAVDVAVNARLTPEPFGRSVVEAMMMERPVIAHAAGGPTETVRDGVTGWLVGSATLTGFRTGIARAYRDRARWGDMGELGRRRAVSEFSRHRYRETYRELLEGGDPPRDPLTL